MGDASGKGKHDKACFYFEDKCIFRLLCWGVPHVPKVLVVGPIKWLLVRKRKEK